jgi:small GTP-binding protein
MVIVFFLFLSFILFVGKTCLLTVFATSKRKKNYDFVFNLNICLDEFPTAYEPTVFDNFACVMHRSSTTSYNLELFDTAGQEEWEQLRRMMYANTDVFLVCYSCMQPSSFDNVEKKWMPDVRSHDPSSLVILVSLCIDLRTNNNSINPQPDLIASPMITTGQGTELAKRLKCNAFIECSSMLRFHVREVFECAIDVFERDYHLSVEQHCHDHRQCHTWLCCLMCC